MTVPLSPPLNAVALVWSRKPPLVLSGPWQPMQADSRIGLMCWLKSGSAARTAGVVVAIHTTTEAKSEARPKLLVAAEVRRTPRLSAGHRAHDAPERGLPCPLYTSHELATRGQGCPR